MRTLLKIEAIKQLRTMIRKLTVELLLVEHLLLEERLLPQLEKNLLVEKPHRK
jgi:hypothetical protein